MLTAFIDLMQSMAILGLYILVGMLRTRIDQR